MPKLAIEPKVGTITDHFLTKGLVAFKAKWDLATVYEEAVV